MSLDKERRITKVDAHKLLITWDVIPQCIPSMCPIEELCHYKKVGSCSVARIYLENISVAVYEKYKDALDGEELIVLALHLMPLYKILCKLKMLEISVTRMERITSQGTISIHPVYKEMRETIRLINSTWNTFELSRRGKGEFEKREQGPLPPTGAAEPLNMGNPLSGDPSYYAHMSTQYGKPNRKSKIKRRRHMRKS